MLKKTFLKTSYVILNFVFPLETAYYIVLQVANNT